jgi:hypothetical protein
VIDHTHYSLQSTTKSPGWDFLTIELIDSSPRLARSLPPDIARKHHAIPIASDQASITIAMAHPEEQGALQAVQEALNRPATIVRADIQVIDALIDQNYPLDPEPPLTFIAWDPDGALDPANQDYINYLVRQFNARLIQVHSPGITRQGLAGIAYTPEEQTADLVIFPNLPCPAVSLAAPERKLAQSCSSSILAIHQPRWPIRKILLVLQDNPADDCAIDWAVRTALFCQSTLSVLPVLPPAPLVYAGMQNQLLGLLDSHTRLGDHLRKVAHRLAANEIPGSIKLRNEPPDQQIFAEVEQENYDLIIVGLMIPGGLQKIACPDLALSALSLGSTPILISKDIYKEKP